MSIDEKKKLLALYRLQQAVESLQEAQYLFSGEKSLRSVVNRIYYGMFYSVITIRTRVAGSNLEWLTPRSVNAFNTYGGIGFFHRGATLQEWLIPLVCIQWTKKAGIVLKPVAEITTLEPVVEIEPAKTLP